MRKSLLEGTVPQVVRALNASEAFCLIESPEFAPGLLLVITENLMHDIAGPDFVREIRERVASVPVLVLGASTTQSQYEGIPGVYHSQTRSPQELRAFVNRLVALGEKQYA
jgi:DNA-binding response OmpR family regulator